MKWYILALKKYAVFTGRASRQEFWDFVFFTFIFGLLAGLLDTIVGPVALIGTEYHIWFIGSLYNLCLLVPSLSISVRRFHDLGKRGWVVLWYLIVLLFGFLILSGYFIQGDRTNSLLYEPLCVLWVIYAASGGIWYLLNMAKKGEKGPNKYGPGPLEPKAQPLDMLKD